MKSARYTKTLTGICFLCFSAACVADNLILETFEDGSLTDDSPLTWTVFPGFDNGKATIVDGDLVVQQNGGHSFVPLATTPVPANVSLRAVLQTEDYMTLIARGNPETGTAYGGGIRSDGEVYIERTHPGTGADVATLLSTAVTDLRPAEEDVFLQFDLIGEQLYVTAWNVGDEKPDGPQVSVADSTHSNPGLFGFIKCCGQESSTVQFLQVADDVISGQTEDFDANGNLEAADLDLLSWAFGSNDALFDLNYDGLVDLSDHATWLEHAGVIPGDANFDGTVAFPDFLALAEGFGQLGGWAEGDFNADGTVGFPDFLILAENFGSASQATASVPEPHASVVLLIGLLGCISMRRCCRGSTNRDAN